MTLCVDESLEEHVGFAFKVTLDALEEFIDAGTVLVFEDTLLGLKTSRFYLG